jgi:hypothetical protein
MHIVPEIIAPIKLLSGSHADTAKTGQGCFMNVVAYLNGEPQITDNSPCVCFMVRPLAIKLNDYGNDEQRQRLLPFVLRAMGSSTNDKSVTESRRVRIRRYGAECQEIINTWRANMKAYAADAYAYADAAAYAYADAYAYAYAKADADADAYADTAAYAYADADTAAYAYADAYADAYAKADADAKKMARDFAFAERDKLKETLFDAGLRYLDDVLPQADEPTGVILERAAKLCELAT